LAALERLPPSEKFDLLERLWASLTKVPSQVPLANAQLQVVRERLAEHVTTPDDVVGVDAAFAAAQATLPR